METDRDFLSLLKRLDSEYGDRIALRYVPEDPGASLTYHELYTEVTDKACDISGRRVIEVREEFRLSWIITCLASICGNHMTVLLPPSAPPVFSEEVYEKNYLPGKVLFFTSGTASRNKAVVLSQKALLLSAANGQAMLHCHSDDRLLSCLPLFHVFGFICSFLWPLVNGAEIDLGAGYHGFLTDAKKYRPTVLSIVPTLLDLMLQTDALNEELRMILVGAGPCRKELIDQVLRRGIHLRFGYGLTETASGVAISTSDEDPYAFFPCPDTKAVTDENGELMISTTCMMDGYYLDEKRTAAKIHDGFLKTGDLAEIDENGAIHLKGRTDNVLVLANSEKLFRGLSPARSRDMKCKVTMNKYSDDQIFEKLKEILSLVCPDMDISKVNKDTVINRDNGVDSLNFIMIMTKIEAAYDIRIPDSDWDKLSTAQDVIDKVKEQLN